MISCFTLLRKIGQLTHAHQLIFYPLVCWCGMYEWLPFKSFAFEVAWKLCVGQLSCDPASCQVISVESVSQPEGMAQLWCYLLNSLWIESDLEKINITALVNKILGEGSFWLNASYLGIFLLLVCTTLWQHPWLSQPPALPRASSSATCNLPSHLCCTALYG